MKWLLITVATVSVTVAFAAPRATHVIVDPNGASSNNPNVPPAFKSRAACTALTSGYSPEDLVCNIVEVRPGAEPAVIGTVTPTPNYRCTLKLIADPGNYYHSRIQYGAEVLCGYLAFAGNMKVDAMVDYTLGDDAVASFGPLTEDICNKLSDWVYEHPNKDDSARRLWVREIVRSQQTTATFDKVGASVNVQLGPLVGVKGTVYRRNEDDSRAWVFGLVSYDVDLGAARMQERSVRSPDKSVVEPPTMEETWEPCQYTKPIAGTIK